MSAEAEAGEILVRIMGQGISEMIRLSGQTTMAAGRAAASLMTYCYAVKVGGSPAEIARNPGGMAIITIPEDRQEEFKKVAKTYKLQCFPVNNKNYDEGFVDMCMKAEDVATCQRVLEITGITAVQATGATTLDQQAIAVRGSQTFEEASKKLEIQAQTIEECFNRHTENDYARDEPYAVCDRLHPENYVMVHPQKDVFAGKEYTKSTYTTYKDGVETGVFDDGRFEGRPKNYWFGIRSSIVQAAGIPEGSNDLVYFRTAADHQAYLDLSRGKTQDKITQVNPEGNLNTVISEIQANLDAAGLEKRVPADARKAESLTAESVNGQEFGTKEQKNTTTTKMTRPEEEPLTFEEKAESLKNRSQTFDASLNRRTDRDFARDEPYAVCDRENPMSFIALQPKQAVYGGETYTKTTYQVYRNGELAGTFDDGRSAYRDKYYWGQLKDRMQSAGGFENDMIYFKDLDSLKAYQDLYNTAKGAPDKSGPQTAPVQEIAAGIEKLADNAFAGVGESVSRAAAKTSESPAGKQPAGVKSEYSKGGVKEFAAKYKETNHAPDPELTKAIREKMAEMGMKR